MSEAYTELGGHARSSKKSKKKIYLCFGGGVVVLVAVAVALILVTDSSSSSSSTQVHELGLVSNVFTTLLANNTLVEVIEEARQNGYTYIELRQTSLGQPYENRQQSIPNATAIGELVATFPTLRFSYAFQLPFMTDPSASATWSSQLFQSALTTAQTITLMNQRSDTLLRVVDVTTTNDNFNPSRIPQIVEALAQMTNATINIGGRFIVENARVDWSYFENIMQQVNNVSYCYDPCNLVAFSSNVNITSEISTNLTRQQIFMLHAKQSITTGKIETVVEDGLLDWRLQAGIFNQKSYDGPILFEVSPSSDLWDNLAQSKQYLEDCGFAFN